MKLKRDTKTAILDFILHHVNEYGMAPTIKEIQTELGFKSNRSITYHVSRLASKGLLKITPNKSRSIMPANVIVLAFLPEEMAILRDRSAMEKKSVGEHIKVRLNLSGKF